MTGRTLGLLACLLVSFCSGSVQHDKVVSCYYNNWSFYSPGEGRFDIDDIEPALCTHGFYAYANVNDQTWQIEPSDAFLDLGPSDCPPGECVHDGYRRFTSLDLIPMISVGGYAAGTQTFSNLAADPTKREIFILSVVDFLGKYGFAGLDVDWEYPSENDRDNFKLLSKELSDALHAKGYLLTTELPSDYKKIDAGYDDLPLIAGYYDFLHVLTFDYHGWFPGERYTAHDAPLRLRDEENVVGHPSHRFSVMNTVDYLLQLGAPMEKMVMAVPAFGRGFHLKDTAHNGLYCKADCAFPAGPYTRAPGVFSFLETQQLFNNDSYMNFPEADGVGQEFWTKVVDDCYLAPYIYNGPYWLGYDDEESISWKVRYFNLLEAKGVIVWTITYDDFKGAYSPETYPILRAINAALESGETYDPHSVDGQCGSAPMCDV